MDYAPVWCDITTRFELGCSVAVCSTALVINRRLYHIVHSSTISATRAKKRRDMLSDLAIGMGFPIAPIALYWFYEEHRFDIYEGVGCFPAIPNSFIQYILLLSWPILIGLVSGTYCVLTIRTFFRRRRDFGTLIALNSDLSYRCYFRVMGLAAIDIICAVPLGTFALVWSLKSPIYPFVGLSELHSHFAFVPEESEASWRTIPGNFMQLYFPRWTAVGCARYRLTFSWLARCVGIKAFERSTNHPPSASLSFKPPTNSVEPTIATAAGGRTTQGESMDNISARPSADVPSSDVVDEKPEAAHFPLTRSGDSGALIRPPERDVSPQPEFVDPTSLPLSPQRAYHPDSPIRPEPLDVPSSPRPHSADMV
ncbi:hypothetical protein ONZ51_g1172 [Trametes cubensis]|uniref:Pheromone receptor n=1 Tax=Trametes cubensis TaxID=1111947 RepID=A0AAD7XHZ9_9APHY|nr:hypothetical protein ONZ51_g1172 [Trametes cubensis]